MSSNRAGGGLGVCDQRSRIVSLPTGKGELGLIGRRSNDATERSLVGDATVSSGNLWLLVIQLLIAISQGYP